MNQPLVSIVMAAFNEGNFIGEAIDSVLNQTYSNFEFIIVNDGSTDNTDKIILSFSDTRIKYIKNQRNLKLIASLNKGLTIAEGKYIARFDADDICFSNRLEKQVSFMESNPEIGLSGAQQKIFGNNEGVMSYPLNHEDIMLKLFITSSFGNNTVIFRKEIMEKYKLYFPEGYYHAEDYKSWTNWIKYTQVANINDYLVKYRSHSSSISVTNRKLQRETRNRIRIEYLIETFQLENNQQIAYDFTGDVSLKRTKAAGYILKKNILNTLFPPEKLKNTIFDLWYADCLEKIEYDFTILLKFPYIFKLGFKKNSKRWWYLLKHFIKTKY